MEVSFSRFTLRGLERQLNDAVAPLYFSYRVHALDHLREHRVIAIELGLRRKSDIELAVSRLGIRTSRKAHGAFDMRASVPFGFKGNATPARPQAVGVPGLDGKLRNHSEEEQAIVELRLNEFCDPARGFGCVLCKETKFYGAMVGPKNCDELRQSVAIDLVQLLKKGLAHGLEVRVV